jgi:hypothetical protein
VTTEPPAAPPAPPAQPFASTPNAEKYVLEADSLRRRQLNSALLHGSRTTWRDRQRIWPAAVGGIIAVIIIVAVVAIVGGFRLQQANEREREREREQQGLRPPAQTAFVVTPRHLPG